MTYDAQQLEDLACTLIELNDPKCRLYSDQEFTAKVEDVMRQLQGPFNDTGGIYGDGTENDIRASPMEVFSIIKRNFLKEGDGQKALVSLRLANLLKNESIVKGVDLFTAWKSPHSNPSTTGSGYVNHPVHVSLAATLQVLQLLSQFNKSPQENNNSTTTEALHQQLDMVGQHNAAVQSHYPSSRYTTTAENSTAQNTRHRGATTDAVHSDSAAARTAAFDTSDIVLQHNTVHVPQQQQRRSSNVKSSKTQSRLRSHEVTLEPLKGINSSTPTKTGPSWVDNPAASPLTRVADSLS
eukprot:Lankesteria_metandrocarpae@DN1801_c0_g1_i1.p1